MHHLSFRERENNVNSTKHQPNVDVTNTGNGKRGTGTNTGNGNFEFSGGLPLYTGSQTPFPGSPFPVLSISNIRQMSFTWLD